jgi:signal transduction histidine kinase
MKKRFDSIGKRWESFRNDVEIADIGFLFLRTAAPAGHYAWILLSGIPEAEARIFFWILRYFIVYSLFLYLLLFLLPRKKEMIYGISLGFDLSYVYLLCSYSGGYESSFFIGFYLLTALHSFYFGPRCGLLAAAAAATVYFFSGYPAPAPDWIDFGLRGSFLFLIALPLGILSAKLRADKEKIASLNEELLRSLDELKRLQDKLIRAERLSALGRLTSDVAHEIRNPLTVVGGFARRLSKRLPEDAKEKEYAGIIVSEVARLERILKDILAFSREAKHHKAHADLNDIVSETVGAYADLCREKAIRISFEPAPRLPPCVVDRDQVRQAVNNLVQNAVDAMPSGGTLKLRTRTEEDNGAPYVLIEVADTGVGIPNDKMERIFEPFYSRKEIGQGTGLGLSICKKIMEEHEGFIRAESTPFAGSAFRLFFPYTPAEEAFKVQCWEHMKCGAEKNEGPGKGCPAYPNFGRICWTVAGVFSERNVRGIVAHEVHDCRKCEFYLRVEVAKDL